MTRKSMKHKGVAIAILLVIVLCVLVYASLNALGRIVFRVLVNGQDRGSLTIEGINKWDGIDSDEAIKMADATFRFVMGGNVLGVLTGFNIGLGVVEAHYVWGYDAADLGHVFDMKADLWTGTIVVTHCK